MSEENSLYIYIVSSIIVASWNASVRQKISGKLHISPDNMFKNEWKKNHCLMMLFTFQLWKSPKQRWTQLVFVKTSETTVLTISLISTNAAKRTFPGWQLVVMRSMPGTIVSGKSKSLNSNTICAICCTHHLVVMRNMPGTIISGKSKSLNSHTICAICCTHHLVVMRNMPGTIISGKSKSLNSHTICAICCTHHLVVMRNMPGTIISGKSKSLNSQTLEFQLTEDEK